MLAYKIALTSFETLATRLSSAPCSTNCERLILVVMNDSTVSTTGDHAAIRAYRVLLLEASKENAIVSTSTFWPRSVSEISLLKFIFLRP